MPIIDIAVACGFESPSHFSKCYKKHYGTLPSRERAFETQ
jgi:transcriptional regulator GlxA family with amidase domain